MYNDTVFNLDRKLNVEFLIFSDKYNIQPMYNACQRQLIKTLRSHQDDIADDDIIEIIQAADYINDKELFKIGTEYIQKNFQIFTKTENWKDFANKNHHLSKKILDICQKLTE